MADRLYVGRLFGLLFFLARLFRRWQTPGVANLARIGGYRRPALGTGRHAGRRLARLLLLHLEGRQMDRQSKTLSSHLLSSLDHLSQLGLSRSVRLRPTCQCV